LIAECARLSGFQNSINFDFSPKIGKDTVGLISIDHPQIGGAYIKIVLGAAMPNGPKIKSPSISMKFGDILESTLTKM
jgi:hypothetical protein